MFGTYLEDVVDYDWFMRRPWYRRTDIWHPVPNIIEANGEDEGDTIGKKNFGTQAYGVPSWIILKMKYLNILLTGQLDFGKIL